MEAQRLHLRMCSFIVYGKVGSTSFSRRFDSAIQTCAQFTFMAYVPPPSFFIATINTFVKQQANFATTDRKPALKSD
jgi:hypothetical protein